MRTPAHHGVLVIPSAGSRDEQLDYIIALATYLRATPPAMDALKNHIVAVDEKKIITRRWACAEQPVGNIAGSSSA